MNNAEFQLRGVSDPRLAVHATGSLPAWLWSIDGARILWANPLGVRLFDAPNGAALATTTFGPADPHRRQVTQLAGRLLPTGALRLERLRGFGASLGGLMTCGCARLDFSDGSAGILVVATRPSGRLMPLVERLQRLVEGVETPIAAFAADGMFVGASDAAHALLGFHNLSSDAGLASARTEALRLGRVETPIGIGTMVLQRVGSGADIGLVALIKPTAATAPAATPDSPDQAADARPPDDEPAESELIDEFAVPPDEAAETAMHVDNPTTPSRSGESLQPRQNPLRLVWQMDADGRFSVGSDEFTGLIGARTAAALDRTWNEIAEVLGLDPEGLVNRAIATRDTWSGVTLSWPVDGGAPLPVELSALPIFDSERNFIGYRGFGVCRDLDGLTQLASLRRHESCNAPQAPQSRSPTPQSRSQVPPLPAPLSADIARDAGIVAEPDAPLPIPQPIVGETSPPSEPDISVETPKNVLPFRPVNEAKSPSLTQVENNTFDELARQLEARLEADTAPPTQNPAAFLTASETSDAGLEWSSTPDSPEPAADQPQWLSAPEPPARGEMLRDRSLLDLLPTGVLIYRLDRLLYANCAFLDRIGYENLRALEDAGGLDALFVEPVASNGSSTSGNGTAVTIAASPASADHAPLPPTEARLFTISWNGESALALICANDHDEPAAIAVPADEYLPAGCADAEDLGAILDATAEGVVMFDAEGRLNSCNRSAEVLFGYDADELTQRNLADLFAPESLRLVREYLESVGSAGVAGLGDQGHEVQGRLREGGLVPLSMSLGRTRPDGPNFFAVFRDLSQARKSESELLQARRQAERSANAKADVLARISHEVRTPLNAIIGFAEVMIEERFGAIGNERYVEYMKDIRASGERVTAIIDDLLELSRIETGKIDLAFANQNLNALVESCVAVLHPQANRERIIIRTSLAHTLPTVVADARALRQITLNLIGNSIHLANTGGQVIVSTALSDFGEVVLRVRDSGHGLNDNELAAAMEPFRTHGPADQANSSGVNLSLTKALVEANRAQFQIKTGPHCGTLIEVVFPRAVARG